MKEYALSFKATTTGNNTATGNNCPIQIAAKLFEFSVNNSPESLLSNATFSMNCTVIPDEPILPSSSAYTGIDDTNVAELQTTDLRTALQGIAKLIQKIENKNIYVIGWNVLEDNLDALNANLERIFKQPKLTIQQSQLLDIQELATQAIPIDQLGTVSLNSVTFKLTHDYAKLQLFIINKNPIEFSNDCILQWTEVLMLLMQHLGLKTLKEVQAYLNEPKMLDVMPFGKHKGEKISSIFKTDNDYLLWLHSCKEIMNKSKSLKFTLDQMLAI